MNQVTLGFDFWDFVSFIHFKKGNNEQEARLADLQTDPEVCDATPMRKEEGDDDKKNYL
jgi:hypothetical protein